MRREEGDGIREKIHKLKTEGGGGGGSNNCIAAWTEFNRLCDIYAILTSTCVGQ